MDNNSIIFCFEHFNHDWKKSANIKYLPEEHQHLEVKKHEIPKKDLCFCEIKGGDKKYIQTHYFIGVQWIEESQQAIFIQPKLDNETQKTDHLSMLFSALKHPEISHETDGLFEIKWNEKPIEIKQQDDLLTPLLVVQFLSLVKDIVRKGLKKSYYKIERNLYAKIKGKVLVGQTIKHNLVKNKPLNTYCHFEEFGWNGLENRLLKRTLVFIQRYLPQFAGSQAYLTQMLSYIMPAFAEVSEEVELHEIKHTKTNAFYKAYEEAIRLAKLILRRFGYNINHTSQGKTIQTPPFWIDMSKLFELYVWGLLIEDKSVTRVDYQVKGSLETVADFVLCIDDKRIIADAKYKPQYEQKVLIEDIRQLSGYARDSTILAKYEINDKEIVPCLIIYPQKLHPKLSTCDFKEWKDDKNKIQGFIDFFKITVDIPMI